MMRSESAARGETQRMLLSSATRPSARKRYRRLDLRTRRDRLTHRRIATAPESRHAEANMMFDVGLPAGLVRRRCQGQGRGQRLLSRRSGLASPAATLYFSDIAGNRILKLATDGAVSVFRADSGRTNGNTFDAQGRLISCEGAEFGPGGRRRVVRTDVATGEVEVLTDRFEGKRYNAPNDVVRRSSGPHLVHRSLLLDRPGAAWRWAARPCTASMARTVRRVVSQPADRTAQRPGDHARRQDAVCDRQPQSWPAAIARSGPSTSRPTARSPANGWCSTSAAVAAATACGSTGRAICGSRPECSKLAHAARNGRREDRHLRDLARRQAAGSHSDSRRRADQPDLRRAPISKPCIVTAGKTVFRIEVERERLLALSADRVAESATRSH